MKARAVPRPSTAPANKGARRAFDIRPLGRLPMPSKLQAEVQRGSAASVIAALKSECLMLQRRIDELRGESAGVEMEMLEQTLLSISTVDVGDRIEAAKRELLELLGQKVSELSRLALERCEADVSLANGPGRTAAFVALVDFILGVQERRELWAQRIERANVEAAAGTAAPAARTGDAKDTLTSSATQCGDAAERIKGFSLDTLDLALNEPTVAEVRKLIEEQRRLAAVVQTHFARAAAPPQAAVGAGSSAPQSFSAAPTGPGVLAAAGSKKKAQPLKADEGTPAAQDDAASKLKNLSSQNAAFRQRIVELELQVQKLQEERSEMTLEVDERDFERNISAFALDPAVRTTLTKAGVDVSHFLPSNDAEAAALGQRFSAWTSEIYTSFLAETSRSGKNQSHSKRDGGSGGGGHIVEGLLLSYLKKQGDVVRDLLGVFSKLQDESLQSKAELADEVTRLRRVVASLEQRVETLKAAAARANAKQATCLTEAHESANKFKKLYEDVVSREPERARVVNVKNQSATHAEREKALQIELVERQQCIADLTGQLQTMQQQCDAEKESTAVAQRERQSLLQRIAEQTSAARRANEELQAKVGELTAMKEQLAALRRDLRERGSVEAEAQQRAWKLEVELHIAQNVISELRQREEVLTSAAMQARECQEQLRTELDEHRDSVARLKAEMEQHVKEAETDRVVAQEVLASERTKMIECEREVERLRSLDMQMEVLEQNFTNYAASKLAQREASEEEERALTACMEAVQRDTFQLPVDSDSQDQLRMYLRQLEAQKVSFDNEERIRKRNKATSVNFKDERSGKKQLTHLLRMRYNAIQIFAVQQRLRQLEMERTNRDLTVENAEIKRRHDTAVNELSQARLQCDSLVQRTTELDLERKQLVRTRTASDLEIKNLKAAIQRMRVSGEEQEKILVEVGTRLQCLKMHEPGADAAKPLDSVVISPE